MSATVCQKYKIDVSGKEIVTGQALKRKSIKKI